MPPNESHELYMGLPAFVGRSKDRVFDGVKQRIFKKLPAGLCHYLQLMITKFWWSNNKECCIYCKKMLELVSVKV